MKKKILTALASILASLGIATSAMAVTTEFHGQMQQGIAGSTDTDALAGNQGAVKTDYFSYNGRLGGYGASLSKLQAFGEHTKSNVWGMTKARLEFQAKSDDGLAKFVYGLEVGTVDWGYSTSSTSKENGFGLSGDGVNQETRFAYLEFAVPGMGKDHKIMAGLQPVNINDWVWKETAAGLSYHGKQGDSKWQLGWVRGENGGNNHGGIADADNDYFWGKVEGKLSKEFKLGGYLIYSDLGEEASAIKTDGKNADLYDATYWYVGLNADIVSGKFFGGADLIYQGGDIEFQNVDLDDMDRSAWLGTLSLGYKISDAFKMYANFIYVSGDDDPYDNDASNFDSIDVDVKVGQIFTKDGFMADMDRFYSDAPYIADAGLINYSIGGKYAIDKKNDLRIEARYLQSSEDIYYTCCDNADDLGVELDFWYDYKYNKNLKLVLEGAYLFSGDALDLLVKHPGQEEADNIFQIVGGAEFKF
jgi:hypothetical protein